MNVLILSCGRRCELVEAFKSALKKNEIAGKIVGADCSDLAPGLYFCDEKVIIPKVSEPDYIEKLITIINSYNINLVIPTIDTELLILSKNKKYIEDMTNATILVSSEKVINICNDKTLTSKFFENNGFDTPKVLNINEVKSYPVFIKPLNGSSSKDTFIVKSKKELSFFSEYIDKPMIQEYIVGEEFTIDVCLNFDFSPVSIVPRLRVATRGGEVLKGRIVKDKQLIDTTKQVLEKLKAIGHITIQCIRNEKGIYFIEINPRYGGGVPISIKAGAHSPDYIVKMLLLNKNLEYRESYLDNLIGLRYDQAIYLDEKGNILYD